MRKTTIGILGLALLLVSAAPTTRRRIAISAKNFQAYFESLNGPGSSLGPVERIVFSLMLANTNPPQSVH